MSASASQYWRCADSGCRGVVVWPVTVVVLAVAWWCPITQGGLKIFDPNRPEDRRADGSHFDPNAPNADKWHEWWYFNFHDPNVEVGGCSHVVYQMYLMSKPKASISPGLSQLRPAFGPRSPAMSVAMTVGL